MTTIPVPNIPISTQIVRKCCTGFSISWSQLVSPYRERCLGANDTITYWVPEYRKLSKDL